MSIFQQMTGTVVSKDNLIFVLGELEALITTQQFNYLLVAGDFNIDFSRNTVFCSIFSNLHIFMH